jgi:hypothetical protein
VPLRDAFIRFGAEPFDARISVGARAPTSAKAPACDASMHEKTGAPEGRAGLCVHDEK